MDQDKSQVKRPSIGSRYEPKSKGCFGEDEVMDNKVTERPEDKMKSTGNQANGVILTGQVLGSCFGRSGIGRNALLLHRYPAERVLSSLVI
jgi:hypothetical protein